MQNLLILDCETLQSATDCLACGQAQTQHNAQGTCIGSTTHYAAIGWDNHTALGLSIGCYYDAEDYQYHFFDAHTLPALFLRLRRVERLITFNGRSFDLPLLIAQAHNAVAREDYAQIVARLNVSGRHYDILHEIWRADPEGKFQRGNSLDAIVRANGIGAKSNNGALAPTLWAQGHWAEVINYCRQDVTLTKELYEHICRGETVSRGISLRPILLRFPDEQLDMGYHT